MNQIVTPDPNVVMRWWDEAYVMFSKDVWQAMELELRKAVCGALPWEVPLKMFVQGTGPGKSSCSFIGNISQLTKIEIESVLTAALTAKSFRLNHAESMMSGAPFEMTGMEFGNIRFHMVKNWPGCIDMNRMAVAPESLTQEPYKWQHH